jgi:hypothetical protein
MFTRTALTGLLVAAVTAIFPAFAGASIAPTLALEQGAGTAAGSSPATGLNINFNPKLGIDSVKDLTIGFPPGFLLDLDMNGGSCVASSAPSPLCRLGTGMVTIPAAASGKAALTLYLVEPPSLSDVAGVVLAVEGRPNLTGALTLSSSPNVALSLSFSGIEEGITEMQFTLASPRLPTSCSTTPSVSLQATSWEPATASTSAPLTVSGCGSLPYAPTVAASVTDEGDSGADVTVTLTQGAGESATSAIDFGNPTGVKINKVLSPCFNGTTCTVGTVSASSPLLPSAALASGMLTLAGSINSGSLSSPISGSVTMSFPPPYQFSVTGPINLNEHTISFLSVPDIPLSQVTYNFTGVPAGPAFTTACESGTIAATLVPQDGNPPVKLTGPVTNVGCPPPSTKPTASGSLTGLSSGKPVLQVHAAHAPNGPDLASLSIALPSGLSFGGKALVKHKVCKGSGRHAKCTTHVSARGLSLSGASVKSVRIQGGALVIAFTHAAASVSLAARGPLLLETKTLKSKSKRHKQGTLVTHLHIIDADGHATAVSVP